MEDRASETGYYLKVFGFKVIGDKISLACVTILPGGFVMDNYECWRLVVDIVVGLVTAGAVIYAARTASRWQKRKQKVSDIREITYYAGILSLVGSVISYHLAVPVAEEIKIDSTKMILRSFEDEFTELKNNKAKICQLSNMSGDNVHQFLHLLIDLNDVIRLGADIDKDKINYFDRELKHFGELLQNKQNGIRKWFYKKRR
jgi:hypothetical protein